MSDRPRGGLAALCIAQTTSWGLLYYSLPVSIRPITDDTGWSDTAITAAFSAGLIVSALAGIRVGRILDRHGPRLVMTAGAVLGTAALVLVGTAPALPWFIAAWLVAGPSADRPDLGGRLRRHGVRAADRHLNEQLGWRGTYLVLAGIMAAVTVPLHWFFLNARWSHSPRRDITSAMHQSYNAAATASIGHEPSSTYTLQAAHSSLKSSTRPPLASQVQ
ncbi:MFS transporter [Arthrobacter sp. ISL-72]|uniref:MFS transporter n=1 Tax=Arthrobacter sp. ISL-72 TaxID=2819114 RepID=UPI001BE7F9AD|nr:MFS transporter [Arthrobacter sp. ISL-72]MBT2596430.1 hypothetical protein [Arthrobacter sp. ISL-72]